VIRFRSAEGKRAIRKTTWCKNAEGNMIPGRLTLSWKKSGAEKLDALIQMQADLDSPKVTDTELGNGARTFRQTVIKPILGCWVKHFDSDKDPFIEKYGDFSHSMFHTSNCKMARSVQQL
ncbi:hypothetical protein HDU97_006009, partial [Phlyctochytrium planicorne]